MFEVKHVLLVQRERIKWLSKPKFPLGNSTRVCTCATSEPICGLEASLWSFLPWFSSMETSVVPGGSGARGPLLCACAALCPGTFPWIPGWRLSQHHQHYLLWLLFTNCHGFNAVADLCCTSPRNKTLRSKVIDNKLFQTLMPDPEKLRQV